MTDVANLIVAFLGIIPIGKVFSYLKNYDNNIQEFRNAVGNLEARRHAVQQKIDDAKRNVETILADVTTWCSTADTSLQEAKKFLEDEDRESRRCLSRFCLVPRYSQSRAAKKKIQDLTTLIGNGNFSGVSVREPPVGTEFKSREFESRKSIKQRIMAAVKNSNVNVVAICGMGGIGKTTMAKEIMQWAKKEKLFDEVFMVVVSQSPDLKKIQCAIAESLCLKLEEETLSIRADRLRERLKNVKKFLIILDDLWERLNLEELGIPCGRDHDGSKFILTSRSRDVCGEMEAEIIAIEILSENEAWSLFKEMAGHSVEAPELCPVAKLVANECNCLPLALVTVGRALKNKIKPVWDDALLQLKTSIPRTITEVQRDVYRPLELSYNHLDSPEGKSLFLHCCLFPEDFDIPLEDLVRYGMGLDIFGGIQVVKQARNRVCTLIERLKDRFLLLDSDIGDFQLLGSGITKHVKMHDVIRDVAISIASKGEHVFMISHDVNLKRWPSREAYKDYTAISIITDEITELPGKCPKLELLRLVCNKCPLKVLDSFLAELSNLKVLDIDMQDNEIPSMPSSLGLLKNLRTLHLKNCKSLKDITLIGEIVNLEILSLVRSSIDVLRKEIGRLLNLRLLELRDCFYLTTIAPGVFSGLVGLEELYMECLDKFRWETEEEGKEISNAILKELESLSNLKRVVVRFCAKLGNLFLQSAARSLMQLQELEIVNCEMIQEVFSNERGYDNVTDKIIFPKLERLILRNLPNLICFCENIDGIEFPLLTELALWDLPMIKEFCPKSYHDATRLQSFFDQKFVSASLKQLQIYRMGNVSEIWGSQVPTGSFSKLENLAIASCDKLRNLFSPSMARSLVLLRELMILNCPMLEEVVVKEEEAEEGSRMKEIMFPQLETLLLFHLRKLTSFFPVKHALELPSLHKVTLHNCREMKTFSLGPLSTPKLEKVDLAFKPTVWMDDLNNTIRHIYETKAEVESTNREHK